jgi:hypothetical protein
MYKYDKWNIDPTKQKGVHGTERSTKKGADANRCGTLVGDLNNWLGSQETRKEKPPSLPP